MLTVSSSARESREGGSAMSPTFAIVLWWVAFGGAHLVLSSQPVRARLVGRLGLWAFQALYSLIVLALFVPLVDVYFAHKHDGVVLWAFPPSPVLRWIAYVGIAATIAVRYFHAAWFGG